MGRCSTHHAHLNRIDNYSRIILHSFLKLMLSAFLCVRLFFAPLANIATCCCEIFLFRELRLDFKRMLYSLASNPFSTFQ